MRETWNRDKSRRPSVGRGRGSRGRRRVGGHWGRSRELGRRRRRHWGRVGGRRCWSRRSRRRRRRTWRRLSWPWTWPWRRRRNWRSRRRRWWRGRGGDVGGLGFWKLRVGVGVGVGVGVPLSRLESDCGGQEMDQRAKKEAEGLGKIVLLEVGNRVCGCQCRTQYLWIWIPIFPVSVISFY